jgi:hypothetical protein
LFRVRPEIMSTNRTEKKNISHHRFAPIIRTHKTKDRLIKVLRGRLGADIYFLNL